MQRLEAGKRQELGTENRKPRIQDPRHKTMSGSARLKAGLPLIEHAARTEERLDIHRLQGLRRQLSAIYEQMENLRCDAQALGAEIKGLENELTRKFGQRLYAVAAELISIKPIQVPSDIPGLHDPQLRLTPEQHKQFVKKFMAVGMTRKDASRVTDRVASHFGSLALAPIDRYFDVILPAQLTGPLLQQGKLCHGTVMSNEYWVVLTVSRDIVDGKDGTKTLSEEAKQKLRLNILTAIALDVPGSNHLRVGHLDHVHKALEDSLNDFILEYKNNGCKGDAK